MTKDENGGYTSEYNFIPAIKDYIENLYLDKSEYTITSYISAIDRFFNFLQIKSTEDIRKITMSDCRKYQNFLSKNFELKNSTINAYIRPLKALFNFLKGEYVETNPFDGVRKLKVAKSELSFLDNEEIEMMMNACKNLEEKAIFATMVNLGVRRSELVNIKLKDVVGYKVKIVGKGEKYRDLYFDDTTYELVQEYLNKRKHKDFEYLFRSKMGKKYSPEAIRLKIKSIAKRAGIDPERVKEITPHSIRRSTASNLIDRDINMRVIQEVMGHSDISTTMLYAKLKNSAVEKAMRNNGN
jgi:integrase/recombinase XerD